MRKFLAWSREVSSGERALGLAALARGYLQSGLPPDLRREAEAAMAAALDDPSPQVRRALAEVLAGEAKAPRHVVIALAHDQPDIAALVLAQSPLLGDGDLVDCASMGDRLAQSAIASRPQATHRRTRWRRWMVLVRRRITTYRSTVPTRIQKALQL